MEGGREGAIKIKRRWRAKGKRTQHEGGNRQ